MFTRVYKKIKQMKQRAAIKLIIVLVVALIWLPYVFAEPFNFFEMGMYYQEGGLFPWIILFFSLIWLFSKRSQLISSFEETGYIPDISHLFPGVPSCLLSISLALVVGGPGLPRRIFPASLFIAGIFSVFGTELPLILSAVYGVGVFLPILIKTFIEIPFSLTSVKIFSSILRLFGYPIRSEGVRIYISSISGETIVTHIDSICAGSSSLTVFMALFILVTLDTGIKPSRELSAFFLAGCLGTYAQAILRLIIISLVGFYFGEKALWKAHIYTGYIIFILFFAGFIYLYMRWVKAHRTQASAK